jgi:hypothetical protein
MVLWLENFEDAPTAASEPAGPTAEWLAGHAAGREEGAAEARAAIEAEEAALSRALAQSLEDAAWSYAEARAAVLRSLEPLLEATLARLLPAAAGQALLPRLLERLMAAAEADSRAPLAIHVAPSRAEALRRLLPSAGAHATVAADPTLGPDAARLVLGARESALDLDACLLALQEGLGALLPPGAAEAWARPEPESWPEARRA